MIKNLERDFWAAFCPPLQPTNQPAGWSVGSTGGDYATCENSQHFPSSQISIHPSIHPSSRPPEPFFRPEPLSLALATQLEFGAA